MRVWLFPCSVALAAVLLPRRLERRHELAIFEWQSFLSFIIINNIDDDDAYLLRQVLGIINGIVKLGGVALLQH